MVKLVLVHATNIEVLKEYIESINIIHKMIPIKEFRTELFLKSTDVYIFTQMWINLDLFPKDIYTSDRFVFLNVEMLTEINRYEHVCTMIKNNIRILDYSIVNVAIMKAFIADKHVAYPHTIMWIPYQFNIKEWYTLENQQHMFKYDIGVINAFPRSYHTKDPSVNASLTYKRAKLFEQLQAEKFNCINIVGWGEERDEVVKQCKIIINVHNFECYNIFEHIRCDRLIFANKIIVSDESLQMKDLDISTFVIWAKYDDIINCAKNVLADFGTYQTKIESMNASKKNVIIDRMFKLKESYNDLIHYRK